MILRIKPQNSMVMVQYLVRAKYTTTPGGILIPEAAQQGKDDPTQRARVLAVADDVTCCKPGDTVYVFINDGMEIEQLYRSRHEKDAGKIKLYKASAVLCVAEELTDMDVLGMDCIGANEVETLNAIKNSEIKLA